MKAARIALLALSVGALAGAASASPSITAGLDIGPSGRAAVDVGFFYDDLAPYGNWVDRPQHGWCFVPRHTRSHWRPYEYGHWTLTDYGWTWVSDEPYGWATYHYGRWYDDPDYGWEWVPGQEWGPAWVSWQEGSDYVGWAPLPPSVEFSGNFGVDFGGASFAASLTPDSYLFVPERDFLAPRLDTYIVPQARVGAFWGQTRNFTNYRFENNRFINQGVPVDRIQRVVGRNIPRYQVADLPAGQRHQELVRGNRVALFRPQVQRAARVAPPPARPIARRAVMTAAAAAAVVGAHHAAHQATLQANAANAARNGRNGRLAPNIERQQTRVAQQQARVAQQNVARSRQVQARQQQVAARGQQRVSRQQQLQARQATDRQQRVSRQQVNQARQQQVQARQQQRVSRQQVNQARQQQVQARQQQRVSRQQVNQARQQQSQARQQQRVSRQQASPRQAQAPRNNRPGVQGQPQQARPRGGNPNRRPPNPPGQ